MSSEDFQNLLVAITLITGMGCFTGCLLTWMKWRRTKLPQTDEVTHRLREIADRLARLETSIDATALEVERISEAQRFTTRLLASKDQAEIQR